MGKRQSTKATTVLSEACVPFAVAYFAATGKYADVRDYATFGDLYDKMAELSLGMDSSDRTFWKRIRNTYIYDEPVDGDNRYDDIKRYFSTGAEIVEHVYRNAPPEPGLMDDGYPVYSVAGRANNPNDPTDFIIGGDCFSLKDGSPKLYGPGMRHLMEHMSPLVGKIMNDKELADYYKVNGLQGKPLSFTKKEKKPRCAYDWFIAASEKYSEEDTYTYMLQLVFERIYDVRCSYNIGFTPAKGGRWKFDTSQTIFDAYTSDYDEDEMLVIYDAYDNDYVAQDGYDPYIDPEDFPDYDPNTRKMYTFLGLQARNASGRIIKGSIPIARWEDEDTIGETIYETISARNVLGRNDADDEDGAFLTGSFNGYDEEIYMARAANGRRMPLTAPLLKALHHFIDNPKCSYISPKFDTDDLRLAVDWDEDFYFEYGALSEDKLYNEYRYYEAKLYLLAHGYLHELMKNMNGPLQEYFLCQLFRIYNFTYYYVNMHPEGPDIFRVPSYNEFADMHVTIAFPTYDEIARTTYLTLRIYSGIAEKESYVVQLALDIGVGTGLYTGVPTCDVRYRPGGTDLRTVYDELLISSHVYEQETVVTYAEALAEEEAGE